MKVLILTQGTRGDVQFLAALARALTVADHEVVFGAPSASLSLAEPVSARVVPFDDIGTTLMADPTFRRALETDFRGPRGKAVAFQVYRKRKALMRPVLDELAATTDIGTDVVVHHPIVPGHEIAERLDVPSVVACPQPLYVPTSAFPYPRFPYRLPRLFNRPSYWWPDVPGETWVGNTRAWRRDILGLPRRRGHRNALRRPDGSPATVLQAFSQHLLPTPLDYPHWVHTTGFWFLPGVPEWDPPPQLSEFLAAGDPPVYIGFGSMAGADPRQSGHLVTEAIRLAKVRAVVVGGWGGIQLDASSREILCLEQADFDWLFPRMAAIVHHGGGGTLGAALAAGRPQVVCPFVIDQDFWARRAHAVGVAPEPLPQRRITPERLAEAIRRAVTNSAMAARAAELGYRIRAEDGANAAVKTLETLA